MKKIVSSLLLSVTLILVSTGCASESKTLTCTMEDNANNMFSMVQTEEAVFDGDKLVQLNQNIKMTVKDEYVQYIENMAQGVRDQYAKIQDKDGVKFSVTVEGNVIDTTINAEIAKLDDETKAALSMKNIESTTYAGGKKSLEQVGYTCK